RLVIEQLQRDLLLLRADLDATRGVDLVDRELVGVLVVATGVGDGTGELDRRAERDGLRADGRSGAERRGEKQVTKHHDHLFCSWETRVRITRACTPSSPSCR